MFNVSWILKEKVLFIDHFFGHTSSVLKIPGQENRGKKERKKERKKENKGKKERKKDIFTWQFYDLSFDVVLASDGE